MPGRRLEGPVLNSRSTSCHTSTHTLPHQPDNISYRKVGKVPNLLHNNLPKIDPGSARYGYIADIHSFSAQQSTQEAFKTCLRCTDSDKYAYNHQIVFYARTRHRIIKPMQSRSRQKGIMKKFCTIFRTIITLTDWTRDTESGVVKPAEKADSQSEQR